MENRKNFGLKILQRRAWIYQSDWLVFSRRIQSSFYSDCYEGSWYLLNSLCLHVTSWIQLVQAFYFCIIYLNSIYNEKHHAYQIPGRLLHGYCDWRGVDWSYRYYHPGSSWRNPREHTRNSDRNCRTDCSPC